jgi:hypothetical protein
LQALNSTCTRPRPRRPIPTPTIELTQVTPMRPRDFHAAGRLTLPAILAGALLASIPAFAAEDPSTYRAWIGQMKEDPRGPFDSVKWFCKDGTVLPPKAYACQPHGGGHQHGEWSARTRELRAEGYYIANLLAGIDVDKLASSPGFVDEIAQLLVERYLMAVDDGWIMRKALFYRGAIQEEDERAGARELLEALAAQPDWLDLRFPMLRIGARSLPHGTDSASVQKVRQMSASLSDRDAGFQRLRAKIHGSPEPADADRVRDYAATVSDPALRA